MRIGNRQRRSVRGWPPVCRRETGRPEHFCLWFAGGPKWPSRLVGNTEDVDVFDVKADVLDLLARLGGPASGAQLLAEAPAWYHPGRSGTYKLGPKSVLAHFGEVHPLVLKEMDIDARLVAFEIFLDAIPLPKTGKGSARPKLDLSPFKRLNVTLPLCSTLTLTLALS